MRHLIYNGCLLLIIMASGCVETPSDYRVETTVTKSFSVEEGVTVKVDNRHGNIMLRTGQEGTVSYNIQIIASAGSQEKAEAFLEDTRIDFDQRDQAIAAVTKPGKMRKYKYWWNRWKNDDQSFEINYTITLPIGANLDIINRYGDIVIPDCRGDVALDLAYGNVRGDDFTGGVTVKIRHGKAYLESVNNADFELSYSELKVTSARNLDIKSVNSDISVATAADINAITKYDDYLLGEIDNFINSGAYDDLKIKKARKIKLNARYTDLSVEALELGFDLDTQFGDVEIDNISAAFAGGEISSRYTEFTLDFLSDFSLDLETSYTDIKLDQDINTSQYHMDERRHQISGYRGDAAAGALVVRMSHGSLEIK